MLIEPVGDDVRTYKPEEKIRLTRNLAAMLRAVRDVDKNKSYNINLILSWHARLFEGVREHAGRCRSRDYGEDYLRFGKHRSVHRDHVEAELNNHIVIANRAFARISGRQDSLGFVSDVIKLALELHAAFIRLQAFRDGNKRIGGAILTYVLLKHGILPFVFETPSQEYFDCLSRFYDSNNSDIQPLYNLALRMYSNQLR